MILNVILAMATWGLVFWGTTAAGIALPWQLHLAMVLFLLGPAIARIFRPQKKTKRRRQ